MPSKPSRRRAKRAPARRRKNIAVSRPASTAARSKPRLSSKRIATSLREATNLEDIDGYGDYPHGFYERSYQS